MSRKDADAPRVVGLGELSDFEVVEGYPDIRGWTVTTADGAEVGTVHDLVVDTLEMRTRYLDVHLKHGLAGTFDDRDVLVPIGRARVTTADKRVVVAGLSVDRFALLPAFNHGAVTREHESELLRHFSIADPAATATGHSASTAADTATATGRDFYDSEQFDDSHTFPADAARDRSSADSRDVASRRDSIRSREVNDAEDVGTRNNTRDTR